MFMSEESSESSLEQVEERPVEKKSDCYVVPDNVKPLVECCKDYAEGRIDDGTFFAEALVRTGEFMKAVRQSKSP
jgi:hypothetical protein